MGEIQDGSAVFTVRDKREQAFFDFVYPVGIVVALANDKKPAFMNYGTWEKVAEDRMLQGASDSHAPGTKVEAGLPNITGAFGGVIKGNQNVDANSSQATKNNPASGAFYDNGSIGSKTGGASCESELYWRKNQFSASRSNDIYGNSDTVQPSAYVVAYWQRTA